MEELEKFTGKVMLESNVKSGQFVVGSISVYGFSLATRPVIHNDNESARSEAVRLAKLNPASKYIVLEVEGVVSANAIVWE